MSLNAFTHINFRGNARAALEFYQTVFGGQVTVRTYEDFGNVQHPSDADLIVWGQVATEGGLRLMAYDVPFGTPFNPGENAFFVSVGGDSAAEITDRWNKLADGATIVQPLAPAQWAPLYGMLKDRFGVVWVLNVAAPYNAA